jgi:hypothetical protein
MKRKNPAAVALGRRGGLARAANVRAGLKPVTGKAVGVPATCRKCGKSHQSGRKAAECCRKTRAR